MKKLLSHIMLCSFLLMSNKCANNKEDIQVVSTDTDLAIQLSNDSTFYLAENLVPLTSPRHFDIDGTKIVYGIGNYIIMHDTDSSMQVGYIEIDHKKMDLVENKVYYKSFPYRDDSKLVSTKYVHEEHNISYEGMKTIRHHIEDIYIKGNSIEAAVNMSLYYELGNKSLSGSNTTTKFVYDLDKKKLSAETSNFDFLDDSIYFGSHYLLLGDNVLDKNTSYSWGYDNRSTNNREYPALYSVVDTNGLFLDFIVKRDSTTFNLRTKKSLDEWYEYDFEGDDYFLTTTFSDKIYTKAGFISISADSTNQVFVENYMAMNDEDLREYYNTKPHNYFINEIEAYNNRLKVFMSIPSKDKKDLYKIQTYNLLNGQLITEDYLDFDEFINIKFSKDLKYVYSLHLDEEADMYYIKQSEI